MLHKHAILPFALREAILGLLASVISSIIAICCRSVPGDSEPKVRDYLTNPKYRSNQFKVSRTKSARCILNDA